MLNLFGRMIRLMNAIGTSLVMFIMLVVLADVLGRGLFSAPLPGTPEMVAIAVAVIVFLQIPSTLASGRVIAADGVLRWIGRRSLRTQQWLQAFHHLVGAVLFAITAHHVWALVVIAFDSGDYYGNPVMFAFPKWPVYSVILLGCITMAVQYLLMTWGFLRAGYLRISLLGEAPAERVIA